MLTAAVTPTTEIEGSAMDRELTPRHRIPCAQKTSKPILAGLRCSVRLGFAPFPNCRAFEIRLNLLWTRVFCCVCFEVESLCRMTCLA